MMRRQAVGLSPAGNLAISIANALVHYPILLGLWSWAALVDGDGGRIKKSRHEGGQRRGPRYSRALRRWAISPPFAT